MSCWTCGCCAGCRPRYARLVDSIYPTYPEDGLVKSNFQKLTFYAISHPEKLDRIGEHLAARLSRDVYRQRYPLAKVSAEAMDKLLQSCHGSPSLNLFVESFLKMVQILLETQDPQLQVMATESFVSFSNIQEDTPSYHRRYDFFISKFAELCHSALPRSESNLLLRLAGLRGLRGVVRKTVSDDLQANIWEKQHMDKIVPSILYNMHKDEKDTRNRGTGFGETLEPVDSPDNADMTDSTENAEKDPKMLADTCLRELIGKASFASMKSVLVPVLQHCDLHNKWMKPEEFAVPCFRAIIYSIQAQYSYVVIQALIGHLDQRRNDDADIRVGIAEVISAIVLIASTSIGPSLLEIFNSLLRHLRSSVEYQLSAKCPSIEGEKRYQETLINTMGDFANSLPDYQKVEIMMFIIGKVPLKPAVGGEKQRCDTFLRHVLVKTLLKVATKYRTGHLNIVLTSTFLDPLLKLALVDDPGVRLLTQLILHSLLDRHQNLSSLQHLDYFSDVGDLQLTIEKCSRFDQMFMKKNGYGILSAIFKSALAPDNTLENYDAVLCTLSLLCVEVGYDEVLIELFRVALALQSSALDANVILSGMERAEIQNLVAKYMNLASQLMAIPALCQHVHQVVKMRAQTSHTILNLHEERVGGLDEVDSTTEILPEELDLGEGTLFDRNVVAESLRSSGKEAARLSMPFVPKAMGDSLTARDGGGSPVTQPDGSISLDITSIGSDSPLQSHRASRRNTILASRHFGSVGGVPLTIEKLRQIVSQPIEIFQEEELEKGREIVEMYRTTPFEELVENRKGEMRDVEENIKKILQRVKEREAGNHTVKPKNIFELEFPPMFVY